MQLLCCNNSYCASRMRLLEMTVHRLHVSVHTESILLAYGTLGDHVLDSTKRDPVTGEALVQSLPSTPCSPVNFTSAVHFTEHILMGPDLLLYRCVRVKTQLLRSIDGTNLRRKPHHWTLQHSIYISKQLISDCPADSWLTRSVDR